MTFRPIFGFVPSLLDEAAVVGLLHAPPAGISGPALVVTPNLDHVVQLRRHPAFRAAYDNAALVLCDGFPVHYYARLRGYPARRVTGSGLITRLIAEGGLAATHRVMFVVDRTETAEAVARWARSCGRGESITAMVPPAAFVDHAGACADLVAMIAAHRATMIVMGVGAPQSEVFIDRYRLALPGCWALCVGQGVGMALGLVRRAPPTLRFLHAEWLWRLVREPRRLGPRYGMGAFRFARAVADDLRGRDA